MRSACATACLATVHTGGKALAVPGAYIVGSRLLKELLVNRCRHLIFTTALPPRRSVLVARCVRSIRDDDGRPRGPAGAARFFRAGIALPANWSAARHYIVSIVLGPDAAAVEAARRLQEAGFDVRAIRPPTVPADGALAHFDPCGSRAGTL